MSVLRSRGRTRQRSLRAVAGAFAAAFAVLATSCGGSDGPEPADPHLRLGLKPATTLTWQTGSRADLTPGRAAGAPIDADTVRTIGVIAACDATETSVAAVFNNQLMVNRRAESTFIASGLDDTDWPDDNDWVYDPTREWTRHNYRFLIYSPYSTTASPQRMTFDGVTSIEWNNIPAISADDHLISATALDYDNTHGANGQMGPYKYITHTMRHLMARVRFTMAIGAYYHSIRDIRVKQITVKRAVVDYNYAATFDPATGDATEHWLLVSGSASDRVIPLHPEFIPDQSGLDGCLLAETYTPVASAYILPLYSSALSAFTIEATYDVYDKAGQLMRVDQKASNTLQLPVAGWSVEPGKYFNIRISINPDFLYSLSDNDFLGDGYLHITD